MKTASVMGATPSPVMSRAPSNTLTAVQCCATALPSTNQHIAKKIPIESRPAKKLTRRDWEFRRRIEISSLQLDCACQRTLTRFGSRRWCAKDLFGPSGQQDYTPNCAPYSRKKRHTTLLS